MGQRPSLVTEIRLRADDLKHLVRPKYVKGLTRSDVEYARPMFGMEPLHGQEILVIVGRFRHHIDGSGSLLSSSWKALTYDLAAINGSINGGPLMFKGVTTHLFDRFMNSPEKRNDASWHLFVLGPGELVRGVDICWRDRRMIGLRVQTNQRQSQWFGQRHGIVKSVTAPQGYFINAIEGLLHKTNRWELGLRMCPVPVHLSQGMRLGLLTPDKASRIGNPGTSDGVQTEFVDMHEHVRAIVVKCSEEAGIENLHVLSPELFSRHLAKREEPLPPKQHLFFLRHTEYIALVEVVAGDKILALRFHTNLAKSPWYGTLSDDSDALTPPHRFTPPEKRLQIAGFHGTFGTNFLGSLGVMYAPIPASTILNGSDGSATALQPKSID